jgi:hypothetical protein
MIYIVVFILMCVLAWISYDIHNDDINKKHENR